MGSSGRDAQVIWKVTPGGRSHRRDVRGRDDDAGDSDIDGYLVSTAGPGEQPGTTGRSHKVI